MHEYKLTKDVRRVISITAVTIIRMVPVIMTAKLAKAETITIILNHISKSSFRNSSITRDTNHTISKTQVLRVLTVRSGSRSAVA